MPNVKCTVDVVFGQGSTEEKNQFSWCVFLGRTPKVHLQDHYGEHMTRKLIASALFAIATSASAAAALTA
jgi:hypothetical protein